MASEANPGVVAERVHISVSGKEFRVTSPQPVAGLAFLVGNIQCDVWREGGACGPDEQLDWSATIEVRNGDRFYTVPHASFGVGRYEGQNALGG